jgi:hypothetical protein
MLALLGLRDDYQPDGRVPGEIIDPAALPPGMRSHQALLLRLGQAYTQLEAPVGAFGLDTLQASTRALASDSPGDATYTRIESRLQQLGAARDAIAGQMRAWLLAAAFGGQPVNPGAAVRLIGQGDKLLDAARAIS